jgi:signal transduction histidine kinase
VGLSLEEVLDLVEDESGRPEAIERVDHAIDSLNLVISDIRSYILRLRPALAGEEDPVEALARFTEELGINAVVHLDVDLEGGADVLRSMPPDRRSDMLFIAREALSNVARHAGATQAALALRAEGDDIVLVIEDNGRGFDPEALDGPDGFGRHQGIVNMRARAEGMGGSFATQRPTGNGARIIVRVPVSPSAAMAFGSRLAPATGEPARE